MGEEFIIIEVACIIGITVLTNIVCEQIRRWFRNRHVGNHMQEHDFDDIDDDYSFRMRLDDLPEPRPAVPPLPTRQGQRIPSNSADIPSSWYEMERMVPPELPPVREQMAMNPEDFPKCPIHKCSNRRGQPQKIFWDWEGSTWRCYHGHSFSS